MVLKVKEDGDQKFIYYAMEKTVVSPPMVGTGQTGNHLSKPGGANVSMFHFQVNLTSPTYLTRGVVVPRNGWRESD